MENALFETHAHLDTFEDKELLKNVIEDSKNAGIKKVTFIYVIYFTKKYLPERYIKQSDYIQNVRLMSLGTKIKRRNLKGF